MSDSPLESAYRLLDRAIGRVAPVDAMMWWTVLLHADVQVTGDKALAAREDFQNCRRANLNQVWSAAAFIFARRLLDDPELLSMLPGPADRMDTPRPDEG